MLRTQYRVIRCIVVIDRSHFPDNVVNFDFIKSRDLLLTIWGKQRTLVSQIAPLVCYRYRTCSRLKSLKAPIQHSMLVILSTFSRIQAQYGAILTFT